jgi:hypothetical protein
MEALRFLEQRRANVERVRENSTRLAYSLSQWTTTGAGETIVPGVFNFTCTFLDAPALTSGVSLDPSSAPLALGGVPRVQAGVYSWRRNSQGHYTGAYLYFAVDSGGDYVLVHSLVFQGIATKDLPLEQLR